MPVLILALLLNGALGPAASSADPALVSSSDQRDATWLPEVNRLLEDELKVAARPHIYLVLDLAHDVLLIKGRGIELQRLPLLSWAASCATTDVPRLTGVFTLRARPPVSRPKAAVRENAPTAAIELTHMPDTYDLDFDPGLRIIVLRPWQEQPWQWGKHLALEALEWVRRVTQTDGAAHRAVHTHLRLVVTKDVAQALAWSTVDGMSLLVGPIPGRS